MKTYTVKKIYQYSETVEVVAESEREAKDLAQTMEGDRNYDDFLHDCEVINCEEALK
jgi:hypothetical protein